MPKFTVQIIYKGSNEYVVEATDEDGAMGIAIDRFNNGVQPDAPGSESIENIEVSEYE